MNTSCQKLSGQSNVSPKPLSNHLSHCHTLRAGDGFFIIELVFNSHPNLSAKVLLSSKRAEAGTDNKALDENPATAFITASITSKPLDFTHAVASSPFAPRNCPFPLKKYNNFHRKFQQRTRRVHPIGIFGPVIRKIKR